MGSQGTRSRAPMGVVKTPISSAHEGMQRVDDFVGDPAEFELVVPHSLLDPLGVTMAMIMDRVLARDWEPDIFRDEGDCRIFRYRPWTATEEA